MQKLLTITIPVYNTEQYLKRCLDSLIITEYLDVLDILIIIDGSPDNSLAIAQTYEQQYRQTFRVINKQNGGHGSAVKKGIAEAKGKYFRVLDSDDWFDIVEFTSFLKTLKVLDVDMILTSYSRELIYENRSVVCQHSGIEFGKIYNTSDFSFSEYIGDRLITMSNVTYSLNAIRNSGLILLQSDGFYNDVQYSLFVFPYIEQFVFLNFCVYRYFIGRPEQSVSAASFKRNHRQHSAIMYSCAEFYVQRINNITNKKKEWIEKSLIEKIQSNYYLLMIYLPFHTAVKHLKQWDAKIKELSPNLVNIVCKAKILTLYKINNYLGIAVIKIYKKLKEIKLIICKKSL